MAICAEIKRGTPTVPVESLDNLLDLFRNEEVKRKITAYREGLQQVAVFEAHGDVTLANKKKKEIGEEKNSLPGVVFQAKAFKIHKWVDREGKDHGDGAWRHQEHVVMNGLFIVDIDHVDDPRELWQDLLRRNVQSWSPLLSFVSPSGKGLKMVFPTSVERGNLAQNQAAFAKEFEVEVDKKCKDASRLTFVSTYEDILLVNPQIITYENQSFVDKWNGRYCDGSADLDLFADGADRSDADHQGKPVDDNIDGWVRDCIAKVKKEETLEIDESLEKICYKGIRINILVNDWMEEVGIKDGERHDQMMRLARDMRHIVENNPKAVWYYLLKQKFVKDLIREGDNVERDVKDALAYKYTTYMPKVFQKVLKKHAEAIHKSNPNQMSKETIYEQYRRYGESFKALFKYYPCMKELTYKFGVSSYPAVLFGGACLYGTLATRCFYHHYHEPEIPRRLNYEVFIIADPATGKSGIGTLVKLILSPIMAQDKAYHDSINKMKKDKKINSDAKEKDKVKVNYVDSKVRIHGARTANNVFIEDMVNNVEEIDGEMVHLHLFTFDAELESQLLASKGGQWIDKGVFELKAFHNERDDQMYRNNDSVSGPFDVYWNFLYTGTAYSLYRKVTKSNFGSGLSTRLAVIPLAPQKHKMMAYNNNAKQIQAFNETLKIWANRLDSCKGELPIEPIVHCAWKWTNDLMDIVSATDDDALEFLIKRVCYYGIHCSVPFILMRHWEEWVKDHKLSIDQHDLDLCELFMEVQLFSQKVFFGRMTENYVVGSDKLIAEESAENIHTKTVQQLSQLTEEFTITSLQKVLGVSNSYGRVLVSRWQKDGLVGVDVNVKPRKYFKTEKGKTV